MFLFLSRTVATELPRFDKIFPRGNGEEGDSPLFYFRSIHLPARRNARRDEAGEPRKLHRRSYAEGREREK